MESSIPLPHMGKLTINQTKAMFKALKKKKYTHLNCNSFSLMKQLFISCFIIFGLTMGKAQTPAKADSVTEKDWYGFFNATENPFPVTRMNLVCNPDTLKTCNLNSIPEYNALIDDTTEIFKDTAVFSKADKAYIKRQMRRIMHYRWVDGEIAGMKVVNGDRVKRMLDSLGPDDGWKAIYTTFKQGYNKFSVPLFSLNKKRCIVYRGYDCGSVYGLGNTNVFENRDGKWIIIKSCSPWVH